MADNKELVDSVPGAAVAEVSITEAQGLIDVPQSVLGEIGEKALVGVGTQELIDSVPGEIPVQDGEPNRTHSQMWTPATGPSSVRSGTGIKL